eukprot:EG_transcript_11390
MRAVASRVVVRMAHSQAANNVFNTVNHHSGRYGSPSTGDGTGSPVHAFFADITYRLGSFSLAVVVAMGLLAALRLVVGPKGRDLAPLPAPMAMASTSGYPEKERSGSEAPPKRMSDQDCTDVENHLMNYLTYKAARIVLTQLVETDLSPMKADYMWFRHFCLENSMTDSEGFLKKLSTTRPSFAERLMVTRLDAFTQWSKGYAEGHMRQRLLDSDLRVRKHQLAAAIQLEARGRTPVGRAAEERGEP